MDAKGKLVAVVELRDELGLWGLIERRVLKRSVVEILYPIEEYRKMSTRFDYVKYDAAATAQQAAFKNSFIALEAQVEMLAPGRAKALVLTKLEEAYMWVGKAIRDDQVVARGAELQEDRAAE